MKEKNKDITQLKDLIKPFILMVILLFHIGCGEHSKNENKVVIHKKEKSDSIIQNANKNDSAFNADLLSKEQPTIESIKSDDNKNELGNKIGLEKEYYDDGQLRSEGIFRNGKKEGLHKEWRANGVLSSEGYYEKGVANGLMKWYHDGGYLAGEGLMKNGKRHGIWKVYAAEDGALAAEVRFYEGIQKEVVKIYSSTH